MSEELDRLRKRVRELSQDLKVQEETELLARGCYRCHGAIENDYERRSILMIGPDSYHTLRDGRPSAQARVVCTKCWEAVGAFLSGASHLQGEFTMLKVTDKNGNTLKLRKFLRGKVVWSVQYKQDPPITLNSITNSLAKFCRGRALSYPAMIRVADGRQKTYKGWTCKRVSRSNGGLEMSPVRC